MWRIRLRRSVPALGLALALGSLPGLAEEDEAEVIVVRPEPIGPARQLLATRGLGGALPQLPGEGFVKAPEARVAPRATLSTTTLRTQTDSVVKQTALLPVQESKLAISPTTTLDASRLPTTSSPTPTTTATPPPLKSTSPGGMFSNPDTWFSPTVGGVRLAWCAKPGASCGMASADLYCKLQSRPGAATVSPLSTPLAEAAHLASRTLCQGKCEAVGTVRCQPKPRTSSSPPPPSPQAPPPPSPTGGSAGTPPPPEDATPPPLPDASVADEGPPPDLDPDRAARYERMLEGFQRLREAVAERNRLREERLELARLEKEAEKDVRGPSPLRAVNLLDGLQVAPGLDLFQADVLELDHQVYGDANPKTGLFYYAPRRYHLGWDPESQYALTVIYGMAGQESREGEVFMASRLRAGVDLAEIRLAEALLKAYVRRNTVDGVIKYRGLRPLPLAGTSDVELFGGANNEFTVPSDKITVHGRSGLLSTLDVSWAVDVRRLLNIESLLRTKAGIHGNVTFHAAGDEELARAIPIGIDVASADTFGRIPFDRAGGWRNRTFYPVRLRTLHALVLGGRQEPVVFSWNLDATLVPPGEQVAWDAALVPPWLDEKALLFWAAYSVEGSCEPCDELVFSDRFIPARPASYPLVFTTGDAFEATGAYRIAVRVRSPFLDPRRERVQEQPAVMLTEDGAETTVAQLFLTDRELTGAGADEPFYEWRPEVTMRDGRVFAPEGWIASRNLDLLLGSAVLREALGELPGESP